MDIQVRVAGSLSSHCSCTLCTPLFDILQMPPKFILKTGAKLFEFFEEDGTSRSLLIFVNMETKKETVQCNQCGMHINVSHLAHHQQAAICNQKVASNIRLQNQNEEREKLSETVHILTEKSPLMRRCVSARANKKQRQTTNTGARGFRQP